MEKLKKMEEREFSTLIRVLFGLESPSQLSESYQTFPSTTDFFDPTLNDSQRDAVRFALGAREIALIHGPPGVRPSGPLTGPMIILIHHRPAKLTH